MDRELDQSVQFLKGVGPARADVLRRLGILTVLDLLFHLPRSFDDLSDVRPVDQLVEGALQTVHGEVVEVLGDETATGKQIVRIVIADEKGSVVEGIWFNQPWIARQFRFGKKFAFSGKPKWYRDHWQMPNPRVQAVDEEEGQETKVLPVYALTEELRADQLRLLLKQAVERHAGQVPEVLPEHFLQMHAFPGMADALRQVHFPTSVQQGRQAKNRFIYEEFFVLQVALALRRRELRDRRQAPRLPTTAAIDEHIRKLFPFPLTRDQNQAVVALRKDLGGDRPMQRLLQADVGAGKTAVAVYALLVTVANKHQAALMAPTEVLARQHWQTLETYLAHSRVRRLLLTGSLTAAQRRKALEAIRTGTVDLVVGTQALVQEDVQFNRLGLVVIDEQHKFGVNQRARIRRLGVDPHYLVMTATPIPRTIALTVFGDLDVTIMREQPPGRKGVATRWLNEKQRDFIYEKVRERVREGRQGYIVCPLVAESETLDLKAAEQMYVQLKEGPFRELRLGLLHGRLDDRTKQEVMDRFRRHDLDLLITTVVIEVGVDVPNATLMVLEHADRFGLSQLHQLRGRVTRGPAQGECYLFAKAGTAGTEETRERLGIFCRTSDGFILAEEDARLRGLGEFFGTRQHGLGEFRVGDPLLHRDLLETARQDAIHLVSEDAGLKKPEHAALRAVVFERYGKTLELAEVG